MATEVAPAEVPRADYEMNSKITVLSKKVKHATKVLQVIENIESAQQGHWTCAQCTFEQPEESVKCDMCGYRYPVCA